MRISQVANKNNGSGFTLIETMVAISVIAVGLVSALGIITTSLFYISNIQDRLIAANLTAEGIEVVRSIRDNNWLQNKTWNDGLADGDYEAAYDSASLSSYGGNYILLNPTNGLYNYSLGNATYFLRKISVANLSSYEIRVISTFTWKRRGVTYSSSAEDHLFNWK